MALSVNWLLRNNWDRFARGQFLLPRMLPLTYHWDAIVAQLAGKYLILLVGAPGLEGPAD